MVGMLGISRGKKNNNYLSLWDNQSNHVNSMEVLCTLGPFVK